MATNKYILVFCLFLTATARADIEYFGTVTAAASKTDAHSCVGDCGKIVIKDQTEIPFAFSFGAYLNNWIADIGAEATFSEDPHVTVNLRKAIGHVAFIAKAGKALQRIRVNAGIDHQISEESATIYVGALQFSITKSISLLAEYGRSSAKHSVTGREQISFDPVTSISTYGPINAGLDVTKSYSFIGVQYIIR